MKKNAAKPWNFKSDPDFRPSVSIIVPTYNEDQVISLKLQNLAELDYPKELVQVIVVDSASTDETVKRIEGFQDRNPGFHIELVEEEIRKGKSAALNVALGHARGKVVVVSDADCFWPHDILTKAIPYLANESVGAVAGQEKLLNPEQSWVTKSENLYRNTMFEIQLGESKYYSTVQFEGGFGAYKRTVLDRFDVETGSDDSGTALNVVQKGARTLVLPEAVFYTFFPHTWKGKVMIKTRRARHFARVWSKCFNLLMKRKLVLPKRIFLPEAFLFFVNPFLFLVFASLSILVFALAPLLLLVPLAVIIVPKTRMYFAEMLQNIFIALVAMIESLTGKRSTIWTIAGESRKSVDAEALKKHGLIS
jgi:cellulose synthase/poly-beta-1,6-N-acetylglucosamine synthase-like glycosyltransferase